MICIPIALGSGVILVIHIRRRPTGYIPAAILGNRAFVIASGFTLLTSLLNFTLLFATPALAGNRGDRTSVDIAFGQILVMLIGGIVTFIFSMKITPVLRPAIVRGLLVASAATATKSAHAVDNLDPIFVPQAFGLFSLLALLGGTLGPLFFYQAPR